MTVVEMKQEIHNLIDAFSEPRLALAHEFIRFLAQRENAVWPDMQSYSRSYHKWVGDENDIV